MQLHASCVAIAGRGVLIRGASGSGKSSLALQLLALGAKLVADDRVNITRREDGWPLASAPAQLAGLIEARGVGLLTTARVAASPIHLVVDLNQVETERLPPDRYVTIADQDVPLLHNAESPHFAAAVRQYLLGGKADR